MNPAVLTTGEDTTPGGAEAPEASFRTLEECWFGSEISERPLPKHTIRSTREQTVCAWVNCHAPHGVGVRVEDPDARPVISMPASHCVVRTRAV